MATKNEELLLAIFNSAQVSNINWDSVAGRLGITKNAAQQRWCAFKKTLPANSSGIAPLSTPKKNAGRGPKANENSSTPTSTTKKTLAKKRKLKVESDAEEDVGSNQIEDASQQKLVANEPPCHRPGREAKVEKVEESDRELEEEEVAEVENRDEEKEIKEELVDEAEGGES